MSLDAIATEDKQVRKFKEHSALDTERPEKRGTDRGAGSEATMRRSLIIYGAINTYSAFRQLLESEYCHICKDGGELLCCEGCPRVYHGSCLLKKNLITKDQLESDDDWYCPSCAKKRKNEAKAEALRAKQIKAATAKLAKNKEQMELYKDMKLDPYIKYDSHSVAKYFSSVSEPDYNYSERQLERSPVSDEEATKRAFYTVVWPEFLNRGWRETEGGDFVSPYVNKFDAETGAMDIESAR